MGPVLSHNHAFQLSVMSGHSDHTKLQYRIIQYSMGAGVLYDTRAAGRPNVLVVLYQPLLTKSATSSMGTNHFHFPVVCCAERWQPRKAHLHLVLVTDHVCLSYCTVQYWSSCSSSEMTTDDSSCRTNMTPYRDIPPTRHHMTSVLYCSGHGLCQTHK